MRTLTNTLFATVAMFASAQAFGQQGGQNPVGQGGQNPVGQPGQAIKGQPSQQGSQNPIGQSGQNPVGQASQGIKGQPGQQAGQNPVGQSGVQRGLNVVGQPGQSPIGQPGQNSMGLGVRPGSTQFGQSGLGTQNHFGMPLYQVADVRRSLNLSEDQIGRMNAVNGQLQQRFVDQSDRLSSLSDAERGAVLQKLQANHQQEFVRSANGVFTPDQMRRYQQLEYQYQGPGAFSNSDLRNRFNLNSDQVQRLQNLHDQNTRWLQMFQEPGGSGQDAATRYSTYRQELNEKTNAILNPDQRRAWQEMTGDPYDFRLPVGPGTTTVNNQQP